MLNFLRQPFPLGAISLRQTLGVAGGFGVFVAFVLIVFEPFGTYRWQHPYKSWLLAGYGAIAATAIFINFFGLRWLLPGLFRETHWQVWKEIGWWLLHFSLGGFLSAVYGYLFMQMPFDAAQVSYMVKIAFLIGLFPSISVVTLRYIYLTQKYRPLAKVEHSQNSVPTEEEKEELTLVAENGKDQLQLISNNLVYLEAADNYCTVYYLANGQFATTLLRSSLSRLEGQLTAPNFQRCHRSYLVNLDQVTALAGNAQGYKLLFSHTRQQVPVARQYAATVKAHFTGS